MCSNHKKIDLGFTKQLYPAGIHTCLIYRNKNERDQVIGSYLNAGINSLEKVSYLSDETSQQTIEQWLTEAGTDMSEDHVKQSLDILRAQNAYCPEGEFKPDKMINNLCDYYDQSIEAGFEGARSTGEMSWALRNIPGSEKLPEYEAMINKLVEKKPITTICQYDANRFSGSLLFDIIQVHPFLIINNQIMKNPAYVQPDDFIKDFRDRKQYG